MGKAAEHRALGKEPGPSKSGHIPLMLSASRHRRARSPGVGVPLGMCWQNLLFGKD